MKTTPMKVAKIGYIAISVLLCAVGLLFIFRPDISASIIGIIMGAVMMIFGIIKLVGYYSKDLYRLAFQYDFEFGILLLILGVILLINPENLMTFVCIAIGITILADGLFKIQIAMDSRKFGISSWWLVLAAAIFAGVIGMLLIFQSATGAKLIVILLGVSLLLEGILNFCTVITTVRIIKNQQPDVIEAQYFDVTGKNGK